MTTQEQQNLVETEENLEVMEREQEEVAEKEAAMAEKEEHEEVAERAPEVVAEENQRWELAEEKYEETMEKSRTDEKEKEKENTAADKNPPFLGVPPFFCRAPPRQFQPPKFISAPPRRIGDLQSGVSYRIAQKSPPPPRPAFYISFSLAAAPFLVKTRSALQPLKPMLQCNLQRSMPKIVCCRGGV